MVPTYSYWHNGISNGLHQRGAQHYTKRVLWSREPGTTSSLVSMQSVLELNQAMFFITLWTSDFPRQLFHTSISTGCKIHGLLQLT